MKEVLYSICFSWVFVNLLGFRKFKYKPFNCEKCLAGWSFLVMSIGNYRWWEIPLLMCVAMVGAIILTQTINRL